MLASSVCLNRWDEPSLKVDGDSDCDEVELELETFRRVELHKLLSMMDEDGSGLIDKMVCRLNSLGKSLL